MIINNDWIYKGGFVYNTPKAYHGFIYKITNLITGHIYIGSKVFWFNRKKKFGKKRIASLTDKRLKKYEHVKKESNWKLYTGSSKSDLLNKHIDLNHSFKKEIIEIVKEKNMLLYSEVKHQFLNDVLNKPSYNGNILGKFFKTKKDEL